MRALDGRELDAGLDGDLMIRQFCAHELGDRAIEPRHHVRALLQHPHNEATRVQRLGQLHAEVARADDQCRTRRALGQEALQPRAVAQLAKLEHAR